MGFNVKFDSSLLKLKVNVSAVLQLLVGCVL